MKPVSTLGLTYQALVMLALVVLFASLTTLVNGEEAQKITPAAQGTTPLWANVPETISPEWGAFFSKKGQGRETPMSAPDDLEGWKAVQAANDEAKEGAADGEAQYIRGHAPRVCAVTSGDR